MSEIEDLKAKVSFYENAIRKHRDQRGDDRCWLDDCLLYSSLPEGYTAPTQDTYIELENCKKYLATRCNPNTVYISPQRRIETLEAEIQRLRDNMGYAPDCGKHVQQLGCLRNPDVQ